MTTKPYTATGHQVFARLKNQNAKDAETIHGRLTLARSLLADRAWVEDPSGGGGDEARAIDRLERECFPNLCGSDFDFPKALYILDHVPGVEDWKKFNYSLRRVWADYHSRTKPAPAATPAKARTAKEYVPPISFKDLTELQKNKEQERLYKAKEADAARVERLEKAIESKNVLIENLRKRLAEAQSEVAYWKGAYNQTRSA